MSTTEIEESISSDNIPIIEITENGIEGFEILCRLCANRNDHLIPIYSEEGISNDLSNKMNLYLPVKVSEADTLPLQCCFQCASTVLTWHELVIASVEADRRLRELHAEAEKHLQDQNISLAEEALEEKSEMKTDSEDDRPTDVTENNLIQENEESFTVPSSTVKKRGRSSKVKAQKQVSSQSIAASTNMSAEDGQWVKTEFILCSTDQNNFEYNLKDDSKVSDENLLHDNDGDSEDPNFIPKNVKIFNCKNCNISFNTIRELRRHKKECLIKEETLYKEDLGDIDNDLDDFEFTLETKKVTKKIKREFHCDYCTTVFPKSEELKQHMNEAHPDKISYFEETKRQRKRTKINQETINKAKVVVDSRTYYHCKECGKNLHSPYTYIKHNRIHTGERPHVCDLCGKQFRVSQGLVRHLRETHAGIKNYPCDICGRMFSTRRNVEEHRRIHTNERPYICDLCGKTFKQKASLFVHNRSHNDTFPYRCSYCNQGFRTKPPLLVHITRHTGEKPYSCDICGRSFRIKYEVKRHRLIHSDDKPFSCTECGLSFRQKRYLRNHNKINHNRTTD